MATLTLSRNALDLFELCHRGIGYAYIWGHDGKPESIGTTRWFQRGETPALFNSNHNNYFGVNPTVVPGNEYQRAKRGERDVAAVGALYAEIDDKAHGGTPGAARSFLDSRVASGDVPAPTVLINSGGGVHAYWGLREPLILETPEQREYADRLQKCMVAHVNGDSGAKDAARVLRVPDTLNFKYKPAREVKVIEADYSRLYTIEEIETLVADELAEMAAEQAQPTILPMITDDADYIRRWCIAALEGEQAKMRDVGDGERHERRYDSAYALGGLLHSGGVTEDEIFDALAFNFGADQKGAEKTIRDGIKDGKAKPRSIPEPKQSNPSYDADGHACCPTHNDRLVACKNGNGWRCSSPKLGEPLCFWWQGEGYTPPAELRIEDVAELEDIDPAELRRRYLIAIAERDQWKQRAELAETALAQTKERNRFVAQTTGAKIAAAGKRMTLIDLKKEIDTAPDDGRQDGEWFHVRPSYMGACTNQNKSTISTHLAEFEREGWIERAVKRVRNPETGAYTSATYIRPLVDLSDTSQVVLPAKPRGLHACTQCGSMKVKRHSVLRCTCCGHEEGANEEWINPQEVRDTEDQILAKAASEAELQTTTQDETPAEAATFFEQLPDSVQEPLSLEIQHYKKDNSPSIPELQTTTQKPTTPRAPLIDVSDPSALPGVRSGMLPPDDPWLELQRDLQRKAAAA